MNSGTGPPTLPPTASGSDGAKGAPALLATVAAFGAGIAQNIRAWFLIANVTLILVALPYFAVVLVNSIAFDYNFWFDIPPSDAADEFAVVTLWVLALAEGFVGVVAYGWMCRYVLDLRHGHRFVWRSLRHVVRPAFRASWYAIPAFCLALSSALTFLFSAPVVGVLGVLPVVVLSGERRPLTKLRQIVREMPLQCAVIGGAVALSAFPFWTAAFVVGVLAELTNGSVQLLALIPVWFAVVAVTMLAGGAAAAFEFLRDHSLATR